MRRESLQPARPHDLLRLSTPDALTVEMSTPAWAAAALRELPWVVVRRGEVRDGLIPVGVRGAVRTQRFAAFVAPGAIAERRTPEELVDVSTTIDQRRREAVPALAALAHVTLLLAPRGQGWGPGGSVGFELASGAPTAGPASDLDLVLRQERRLEAGDAADLWAALREAASPARIDVVLETPGGGVALAELAARPSLVLLRTQAGPQLCADPWNARAPATDRRS